MTRVLAAGGLVFNENNELLLIFRYGKWDLPKGHFEPPETLDTCALREVREETGITEHGYFDNKLNIDAVKETHWFAMRASRREELFPQLQEGIEWLRWVTVGELSQYFRNSYENIRQIVEKCLLQLKIS